MSEIDQPDLIKTTQLSLELIEYIHRLGGASVNQLAEELDLANSTIHRHLRTLERYGYVQRYGNQFRLGLKVLDLSTHLRNQWPIDSINRVVSKLSDETEEEIDFFTVDRGRIITLDRKHRKYHTTVKYDIDDVDQNPRGRRPQSSNYYDMHAMAAGKAILAEYPRRRVEQIIAQRGLPAKTENTITNESDLFDELERIRDQGHAVDDEEYALGLRTVAKAVHNPNGGVFGALNVAGPRYRVEGPVLEEEIPNILELACNELEEAISDQQSIVRYQPLLSTESRFAPPEPRIDDDTR